MADAIAQAEQAKYQKMWGFDSYRERSPGMRHLADALAQMAPTLGATVVDFGCGTGRVAAALAARGFEVTGVDIASNACKEFDGHFVVASLWDLPEALGRHQYGFCADVMEHLPTDRVDAALACMARHAGKIYFQIANFHCHEGDKIGEHLHLTVKPFDWWMNKLTAHYSIVGAKRARKHHIFVCKSRVF